MSPKAFTQREKQAILARMKEKGAELLAQYGIRKTSVEDITRASGISKGAFYLFYDTKEALFMEILEDAERKFREQLWNAFVAPAPDRRKHFNDAMRELMKQVEQMPLLARVDGADYQHLVRKVSPESIERHMQHDLEFGKQLIKELKRLNYMNDKAEAETVAGTFRALVLLLFQKEEIGTEVFDRVLEVFIQGLTSYMLGEKG